MASCKSSGATIRSALARKAALEAGDLNDSRPFHAKFDYFYFRQPVADGIDDELRLIILAGEINCHPCGAFVRAGWIAWQALAIGGMGLVGPDDLVKLVL